MQAGFEIIGTADITIVTAAEKAAKARAAEAEQTEGKQR